MDAAAYHQPAPIQILRDRRDLVVGRLEEQRSTGKIIAYDGRGLLGGNYDPRKGTTRGARGVVLARRDVLAALLVCR